MWSLRPTDLSDIREDDDGDSRNWGQSGNKKLHGWEFDRFTGLLEYKAEEHGILVDRIDEANTSKTCSCCGQICDSNRIERGLYVCESCGTTMNADERCGKHPPKDNSNFPNWGYE